MRMPSHKTSWIWVPLDKSSVRSPEGRIKDEYEAANQRRATKLRQGRKEKEGRRVPKNEGVYTFVDAGSMKECTTLCEDVTGAILNRLKRC